MNFSRLICTSSTHTHTRRLKTLRYKDSTEEKDMLFFSWRSPLDSIKWLGYRFWTATPRRQCGFRAYPEA